MDKQQQILRYALAMMLILFVTWYFSPKGEQRKRETPESISRKMTESGEMRERPTTDPSGRATGSGEGDSHDYLESALKSIESDADSIIKDVTFESEIRRVVFSTRGAALRSIRLLDYEENEGSVEYWEHEAKYAGPKEADVRKRIKRIENRNALAENFARRIETAPADNREELLKELVHGKKVATGVELIADEGLSAPTLNVGSHRIDEDLIYRCEVSPETLDSVTRSVTFTAVIDFPLKTRVDLSPTARVYLPEVIELDASNRGEAIVSATAAISLATETRVKFPSAGNVRLPSTAVLRFPKVVVAINEAEDKDVARKTTVTVNLPRTGNIEFPSSEGYVFDTSATMDTPFDPVYTLEGDLTESGESTRSVRLLKYPTVQVNRNADVCFTRGNGTLEVRKVYVVYRDTHDIDLRIDVKKSEDAPVVVTPNEDYELWWLSELGYDVSVTRGRKAVMYQVGDRIMDGRKLVADLRKNPTRDTRNIRWAVVQKGYFVAAMIPQVEGFPSDDKASVDKAGIRLEIQPVKPGKDFRQDVRIFAGPQTLEGLKSQKVGLEDLAFGGKTGPLSRGVLGILRWTKKNLTHSYALSIILITVLLRVLTHPLNKKQMESAERMKALQPMVENLKAKYKDDPQRQQKETWNLYKQHKVNPIGGCLPLLLTMPIFIALWTCFRNAIELRGESFLWIEDLSRADTIFSIPLPFKFSIPLPFTSWTIGPHFPINVLPLLYGAISILQQKKMTAGPSTSPAMKYLPMMFIFIFYSFPAGVMLYLFFSNLLMVGAQMWHEKYGKKPAFQEVNHERNHNDGKNKRRSNPKGSGKAGHNT